MMGPPEEERIMAFKATCVKSKVFFRLEDVRLTKNEEIQK